MKILSICVFCLLVLQFFVSCVTDPVQEMEKYIEQYENKAISNSRQLLELGKIFANHPRNAEVRRLYFTRMIHSGYATSVLFTYLSDPDLIASGKDHDLIINALGKGYHYNLAHDFKDFFPPGKEGKLAGLIKKEEELNRVNLQIEKEKDAGHFTRRAVFFVEEGATNMAEIDLNEALEIDSCYADALFQKCVLQFKKDSAEKVRELLDNCLDNNLAIEGQQDWKASFYELSVSAGEIKQAYSSEEDRLFNLAKLFADNNFPEIAIGKTKMLIDLAPDNADYLALQAFVYYRLGNKQKAMEFIVRAENITGKDSRLRGIIEKMQE